MQSIIPSQNKKGLIYAITYIMSSILDVSYPTQFFLEWKIFQTKAVQKLKTHMSKYIFFFFENHAIYDVMWENIVRHGRPQMTIWHVRIACCIPKATNAHAVCLTLDAFPPPQRLHERASTLRYTYIASLVEYIMNLSFLMTCI
jgi:hypothetical protein